MLFHRDEKSLSKAALKLLFYSRLFFFERSDEKAKNFLSPSLELCNFNGRIATTNRWRTKRAKRSLKGRVHEIHYVGRLSNGMISCIYIYENSSFLLATERLSGASRWLLGNRYTGQR